MVGIVEISGELMKKYQTDYCLKCEFKKDCTSQHRRIFYEPYDPYIEEIRRFYYSEEGQEIYYLRGHMAETSFALLLTIRNFRGIKTKGLEKVNNELTLFEIHHNVKKYEKHTTNDALRFILKKVREYKRKYGKVDFFIFEEIKENLIFEDDVLTVLGSKKTRKKQKKKNTIQDTLHF